MRGPIRNAAALAAAVSLTIGAAACTSQDDDITRPVDTSNLRGGIFEVELDRSDGSHVTEPWIFMFSGLDTGHDNPDWIVGFRSDRSAARLECPLDANRGDQEYAFGYFERDAGNSLSRFGTVSWYDYIEVEMPQEPPEDEDEDAEPPEPVFELAQRQRRTQLQLQLQPRRTINGAVFGGTDPALDGTFRGDYRREWIEARSQRHGGSWYNGVLPRNMEMHVDPEGGFFITDMGTCGCTYTGFIERIPGFPHNLHRFILDSASCLDPLADENEGRVELIGAMQPARGLVTIKPAQGTMRPRLIAVAASADAARVFAFDIERATDD